MIQDLFEKCAWLLKIIIRGGLEEDDVSNTKRKNFGYLESWIIF